MSTLYLTIIIVAFAILLLLNIFFLYIPMATIEKDLNDIDARVQKVIDNVEPFIQKLTPVIESLF